MHFRGIYGRKFPPSLIPVEDLTYGWFPFLRPSWLRAHIGTFFMPSPISSPTLALSSFQTSGLTRTFTIQVTSGTILGRTSTAISKLYICSRNRTGTWRIFWVSAVGLILHLSTRSLSIRLFALNLSNLLFRYWKTMVSMDWTSTMSIQPTMIKLEDILPFWKNFAKL